MKEAQAFTPYLAEVRIAVESISFVIPAQRALHKRGFSFSGRSFEDQLKIWHFIWKNTDYRVQLHAFFFLERFLGKQKWIAPIWETSVSWQEDVDDWPLCDSLAKLNSKALEILPDVVYARLVAWNKDENPWKRRQSVVSLLYYSRTKKSFLSFEDISGLIIALLADKEYYVQKGVGWSLRELHNVYPEETRKLLRAHILNISAIAFTAATEKIDETFKSELKAMRKYR